MKPRVFILGLDGADESSVGVAMRSGKMPNLQRLVRNTLVPLRSTPLPITPAAWTSAYTGYNPGKTGVLTFQRRIPNTYRGRIVNAADVGDNGFHTRLAVAGKSVISVGFPMMSPPPDVAGAVIVSGWDASPSVPLANSARVTSILESLGYRIDDEFSSEAAILDNGIVTRFAIIRELMKDADWDCAMLYLGFIDGLGHRLGFGNQSTQALLERTDAELGALAATLPDDTAFIVCSDHGFGSFSRSFSVTQWLEEKGYLVLRSRSFRNSASGGIPGIEFMDLSDGVIDWSKTRAFCWDAVGRHAAIALNTRGQYPAGIVDPREAFGLAGTIIDELRATTDAGTPVVTDAKRREQLFWGPYTTEFPEIFLETAPDITAYVAKRRRTDDGFEIEPGVVHAGSFNSHKDDGLWGSSFTIEGTGLHIEDLATTVYALLDVPILPDADGINRSPSKTVVGAGASAYSAEEEAIVRKRLEDLGYL
ncbi:MAG TPA: alkaline phosphatase family protein [Verrucomicrobiae bacterium]|nr:alkaline phosphatase family protein [Verrucomicrobiae bacterium]